MARAKKWAAEKQQPQKKEVSQSGRKRFSFSLSFVSFFLLEMWQKHEWKIWNSKTFFSPGFLQSGSRNWCDSYCETAFFFKLGKSFVPQQIHIIIPWYEEMTRKQRPSFTQRIMSTLNWNRRLKRLSIWKKEEIIESMCVCAHFECPSESSQGYQTSKNCDSMTPDWHSSGSCPRTWAGDWDEVSWRRWPWPGPPASRPPSAIAANSRPRSKISSSCSAAAATRSISSPAKTNQF